MSAFEFCGSMWAFERCEMIINNFQVIHAINTTAATHDIDVVIDEESDESFNGQCRDTTSSSSQSIMPMRLNPRQPQRQPIRVFNVFHPDNFRQIISDQGPPLRELNMNCRVCVRDNAAKERCFVEGIICDADLSKCPPVFRVAVTQSSSSSTSFSALPSTFSSANHDLIVTVSRVQIRLLHPPWYEDMMQLQKPPRFISSGQGLTGTLTSTCYICRKKGLLSAVDILLYLRSQNCEAVFLNATSGGLYVRVIHGMEFNDSNPFHAAVNGL